jgi:Fe-S cluster assembly iron-binding protein IscA
LGQGFLKDTVGKPGKRIKIVGGGCHEFKNTITLADTRRNGTDREDVVRRK